jgi:hypothetical protein
MRKELPDKSKPKIIIALLRIFKNNKFVYRTRVSVKKNKTGKPLIRNPIQLF